MTSPDTPGKARRPPDPDLASLAERMGYMQLLRVGFAVVVVGSASLAPAVVGASAGQVLLPTLGYVVLSLLLEVLRRVRREKGLPIVGELVLLDAVYLAWAMYSSGGAESPLRFLVYVHLVAVTLLASYRLGLKIALWHSFLFVAVISARVAGVLDPAGAELGADRFLLYEPAVFNVTAFWLVALATAAFSSLNERELRRGKADLESLAAMTADLDNATAPPEIAAVLLDAASRAFGSRRAAVLGAPEGDLVVLAERGAELPAETRAGPDPMVRRAWERRAAVPAKEIDPEQNPHMATLLPSARNVVVMPLIADGFPLGALVLESESRSRSRIERRSLALLGQFASHAALALRNAWLLESIVKMADTDPLTGVANRRTFEQTLNRELARASRSGEQVSLVMIDVDHFKSFNDAYGHQAGDAALVAVARALTAASRDSDVVARYGGEELAVILPSCSWVESVVAAERLRAAVSRMDLPALTVSAGVATFPVQALDAAGLVGAADEALYRSKAAGRNRVTRSPRASDGEPYDHPPELGESGEPGEDVRAAQARHPSSVGSTTKGRGGSLPHIVV